MNLVLADETVTQLAGAGMKRFPLRRKTFSIGRRGPLIEPRVEHADFASANLGMGIAFLPLKCIEIEGGES